MQFAIRNAAGRSEHVEKQTVAGRTVLRLKHGDRLEIIDPATGVAPVGVKAHRGGAHGNDLIIESFGESVLIEGFFEAAEGEQAVVEFPGGGAPEITPATPELAQPGAVLDTGFAMESGSTGYVTLAQASGAAVSSAGAGAPAAASVGTAAAAPTSNLWWIAGGIASGGAAGAAIEHNTSNNGSKSGNGAPPPAGQPATLELVKSADAVDEGGTVTFTLNTTNVAPGTQYSYTITGISAEDIVGGASALTGVVTIDANGRAVIKIQVAADATTEGLETLTLQIAGQSVSVDVNDTSLTPPFVLTPGLDNVTGTQWDDTINGSHLTYNTGDVINGGAGYDQLNLTLPGGTLADGVKVSNVEQVSLQATAGSGAVELSMTGFDASVQQINIDSARVDVIISDQQSLAAVTITDVANSAITLDYDSQVVSGNADKLDLTIDEFVGALNVDTGIEALDVQVDDGVDEASNVTLTAEGATNVTLRGGIAGQALMIDLAINGERAPGATFDATQFAGNVVLTNVGGGSGQSADDEFAVHSEISTLLLGAGDDTVTVTDVSTFARRPSEADISFGDHYDLGDGNNTLAVMEGSVHGTVRFGTGNGLMTVGRDIGAAAQVSFGAGDSILEAQGDIAANASISFESGNNSVAAASVLDTARIVFNGDGDNILDLETEVVSFVPANEYGRIAGAASVSFNGDGNNVLVAGEILDDATVSFGNGDNTAETGDIEGQATVTFGDGDNTLVVRGEDGDISGSARVSFGDGSNELGVGGDIRGEDASVTFGDGANTVEIHGSIRGSSLTFGDGDNQVSVGGEMQSATVDFGAGANTVDVGHNLHFSNLTFGDGGNTVTVGDELRATDISFGSGNDTLSVGEAIRDGSQVDFGAGDDVFNLGNGGAGRVHVHGGDDATVIDMGDGDDVLTIIGSNDGETDTIVRSGGFLRGGAGNDTLTVKAVDDVEALVARTQAQRIELTFDGDYAVDQVVSVTVGDEVFSYTVQASDIVQGDAEGTRANVASGLLHAIQNLSVTLTASTGDSDDILIVQGQLGDADREVSAVGVTSEVTRIADAGISGFETLNLISVNPDQGEDHSSADFSADFALIEGVQQINLSSAVTLRSTTETDEGIVNGVYTSNRSGDSVVFTLTNLPAGLGEHISVSGSEVTATGNRQVERISIGNGSGDHQIGDVITLTIDDVEYSITVNADDLSGATAQADAENIAARLAAVVQAGNSGFTVARDGNVLTLIGSSDRDVDFGFDSDGNNDGHDQLQCATAADDHDIDVYVNAVLDKDADTDNDTLALTINGSGNFDIGIDGAWDGFTVFDMAPTVAYENLSITVQDSFSHYIDTDDNDDHQEFTRSIALAGGVAGASIVLDDVMAKNVTSTSEADVTVRFDSHADQNANYAFNVSTESGNDVVDMRGIVFSSHSAVDLGAGVDRLILDNGRLTANTVMSGSAPSDEGRMFRNVRNVEELEFHGEDAITFDDDAYDAGFEKLIVGDHSSLLFKVGDEFARDLTVQVADNVHLSMEVYNDHLITVTAEDCLRAAITLTEDSSGDFTLTADDRAEIGLQSAGSGALSITLDDKAELEVQQSGDGDVTLAVGDRSELALQQRGLGAVAVTAGARSEVAVSFGEDSDSTAAVTITQTGSDKNEIRLFGLTQEQDVTVDITVYGQGEDTVIADMDCAHRYDTNLQIDGSQGGIDKLVLRSDEGRGSSFGVTAVIADNWAKSDGDANTFDLTVDASAVSSAYVFLNGSLEDDASLELIGSTSSINVLLGGALGDSLKGGEQTDILQGDRMSDVAQITTVTFSGLYDSSNVFMLTVDGHTITATVDPVFAVSAAAMAEAVVAYINSNGVDDGNPYLTFSGDAAAIASLVSVDVSGAVLSLTGNTVGESFYTLTDLIGTSANPVVDTVQQAGAGERGIASDTLEGGAGRDYYLFAESQFDTMDTIVGLNLGTATADGDVSSDVLALGAFVSSGAYEGIGDDPLSFVQIDNLLHVETVVNAGAAATIDGVDLQAAVASLFQANGWFEQSGSAATNAAGLFNYGDDTYLIAVGDQAGSGFGSDDYIIKVAGLTGTLDVSDFYQPMYG